MILLIIIKEKAMLKYNSIKLNTIILIFVFVLAAILISCKSKTSNGSLPEKEKITINNEYSFVYEFNMKPKLGMVVLKVQTIILLAVIPHPDCSEMQFRSEELQVTSRRHCSDSNAYNPG